LAVRYMINDLHSDMEIRFPSSDVAITVVPHTETECGAACALP